jgi:hypothetical protein
MRSVAVIIATCLLGVAPLAGFSDLITPDQAKAAVRAFEGDPNLEFSEVVLSQDADLPQWTQWQEYELTQAGTPENVDRSWMVDAATGEVTSAYYGDAVPDGDPSEDPVGRLTRDQCKQIAEDFARAKYAGFDQMTFRPDEGEWGGYGWKFTWDEVLPNGASTPNGLRVEVNPVDGRVQSYASFRIAPFTPAEPQITAEQAIDIAVAAAGITELLDHTEPELGTSPEGTWWSVLVRGPSTPGEDLSTWYHVGINAVTGEAEVVTPADMEPSPVTRRRADKPQAVLANDVPKSTLVWVRDLCRKLPGSSVHWLGKPGAVLTFGGRTYGVKPGSQTITWNGGKIVLSRKTVLVNGRLMVPLELLNILKSRAGSPVRRPGKKAEVRTKTKGAR